MNLPSLVAADVRRLTLSQPVLREKDQSPSTGLRVYLVTRLRPTGYGGQASAATLGWVGSWPQCASKKLEVEALYEPPLRTCELFVETFVANFCR